MNREIPMKSEMTVTVVVKHDGKVIYEETRTLRVAVIAVLRPKTSPSMRLFVTAKISALQPRT